MRLQPLFFSLFLLFYSVWAEETKEQPSRPSAHFPLVDRLQAALDLYQKLASDERLRQPLPVPKKAIKPGQSYAALAELAYKLHQFGDLQNEISLSDPIYQGELVDAVKNFQQRHGLVADGILGKKTFAALNQSMEQRIEQLKLNLARWQAFAQNLTEEQFFLVNIPEFKLYAYRRVGDAYQAELSMRVVVGKSNKRSQTPIMEAEMKYVVFSPYWNVPYSIVKNEIYPKVLADPSYLEKHRYQIVASFRPSEQPLPATEENIAKLGTGELKLRQKNGGNNALGNIKFIFPNQYAVYFHDTPHKKLFKRARRDFSHGCIRLAEPLRFAEYVLADKWDEDKMLAWIKQHQRRVVNLDQPIAVKIFYATATVDEQGRVYFLPDIYGRDSQDRQRLLAQPTQ